MQERPRRLELDGAVNFRDLGGYPAQLGRRFRWGRIYRSDSLSALTAVDHERLGRVGLRTLIDFRLPEERRRLPNRLPQSLSIETIEIGFVPAGTLEMLRLVKQGAIDTADLERHVLGQYRRLPVDHVTEYRQMLEVIAKAGALPLLIHCTSGKDRTGYGAAVILMVAGVPRNVILEDYLLTNRFQRDISHLLGSETPNGVAELLTTAQAIYLEAAFAEIDREYGSTDAYLASGLGIDDTMRAHLVDLLTEPV